MSDNKKNPLVLNGYLRVQNKILMAVLFCFVGLFTSYCKKEEIAVSKVSLHTPSNMASDQDLTLTLSWSCEDAISYNVYVDSNNPPHQIQSKNITETSLEINGLSFETAYYWKVVAHLADSDSLTSQTFRFTTKKRFSSGLNLTAHRIETTLPSFVNIMFQVTNLNGIGVDYLTTEDFEVLEDNQPVSPTESAMQIRKKDQIPYTLKTVLLLDNSASVSTNLEEIKNSAKVLVSNIVPKQLIAIYKFSEQPVLVQDFTDDISVLTNAVNSISLGYATTDLYGSIVEGVSKWEDIYSTTEIQQGFLVAFTDGSDTQGSHTLNQALLARGEKKVYTLGLGSEIEPSVLKTLGNAGYYAVNEVSDLTSKFSQIQNEMALYANSFYWMNYMSPKRGNNVHSLSLSVRNNPIQGTGTYVSGQFNSSGFYSVFPGLYIDPNDSHPYGIDTLRINEEDTFLLHAVTYLGKNPPDYQWASEDSNIVKIIPNDNNPSICAVIATGDSAQSSNIIIDDISNNLNKRLHVILSKFNGIEESFENGIIPTTFLNYGNAQWKVDASERYEGSYSACSGDIGDYQSSTLETTHNFPAHKELTISFYYKVSSEPNWDFLIFYINGVEVRRWSGYNDWTLFTQSFIPDADRVSFKWTFVKDNGYSYGQDCSWIDHISVQ